MKIVYCIPGLYNSGGMERVLSRKANYLAELGHEIHIVTTEQMGRPPFFFLHHNIQIHDLEINYEANNGGALWSKIVGHIGRQRAHRQRLEALLFRLRPDITVSMFGNDERIVPKIKDGSHKVLEYHFSKLKRLQYNRRGLWRLLDVWRTYQDAQVVKTYDCFVVLTHEDEELWGIDLPNIRVIANPKPFESSEVATLKHKRIIAAGRYDYQKNFEELIDIWADLAPQYPDWRLDIYGDGKLRSELTDRVERLGLSTSLGLCHPTQRMQQEYLGSSIYAMTSHYEGLPMVLIEAQTMGLPIVSYACQCGPRDIVTHGLNGYLVSQYDKKGFAKYLSALMDRFDERQRMGANAREASARYDLDKVMRSWLELFDELTARD